LKKREAVRPIRFGECRVAGRRLMDVLEDICDEWHVMLQADEYSKAQDEDKAWL